MKRYKTMMLVSMLLFGCRANEEPIQDFILQAHDDAKAQVDPLREEYEFVADEFVMTNERIPFLRLRPEPTGKGTEADKACWQPDTHRERMPLERYPLTQLSMKGVLGDGKQQWAVIYTPEGKLVKIREGYYLGLNHGKVLRVSPNSIDIEETLPDGTGCWLKRPMSLSLVTTEFAG